MNRNEISVDLVDLETITQKDFLDLICDYIDLYNERRDDGIQLVLYQER